LCPDQDPTEIASRKCTLVELWDVPGEEIYQAKVQQLKDEFLKALTW
jgi:hypothetical protein